MTKKKIFRPVPTLSWQINRSERTQQVRLLAPLLEKSFGLIWFLEQLKCPASIDDVADAEIFHLCFPLRDVFTADYKKCRGDQHLEDQFIAYYNKLFGLPNEFGIDEVWKTAPGGMIRHPAAGGRAGWYEAFLKERIDDSILYKRARDLRRMLGTEADLLILTDELVILVELKFLSSPRTEQFKRHQMMGSTLAARLDKSFFFGMVVDDERDPRFTRLNVPYLTWSKIEHKLSELQD